MTEDENMCIICCEPCSPDEKYFFPCPCGFQLCAFCLAKLDSCPSCRRKYNKASFKRPTHEEIAQLKAREQRVARASGKLSTMALPPHQNTFISHLKSQNVRYAKSIPESEKAHVRVLQPNLVYAIGIPVHFTTDELKGPNFFGQYGPIQKMVSKTNAGNKYYQDVQALYITYTREEDAYDAIVSASDSFLEGHRITCCYGTTKYCYAFRSGRSCVAKDCLFLHEETPHQIVFTQEDMNNKRKQLTLTHPKLDRKHITYHGCSNQSYRLPPSWTRIQSKMTPHEITAISRGDSLEGDGFKDVSVSKESSYHPSKIEDSTDQSSAPEHADYDERRYALDDELNLFGGNSFHISAEDLLQAQLCFSSLVLPDRTNFIPIPNRIE